MERKPPSHVMSNKLSTIDRAATRMIAKDAEAALDAVAKKYGLRVSYKSGGILPTSCTLRFEFAVIGEDGEAQTRAHEDYKRLATFFGLDGTTLGSTFTICGTEYKITGLERHRPKYPISAERVRDGRKFKFPVDMVRTHLTKQLAAG